MLSLTGELRALLEALVEGSPRPVTKAKLLHSLGRVAPGHAITVADDVYLRTKIMRLREAFSRVDANFRGLPSRKRLGYAWLYPMRVLAEHERIVDRALNLITGEESYVSRILITGSADGLGMMAGRLLIQEGHDVVFHARNERRAADVRSAAGAEEVVVGDVSTLAGMHGVAEQASRLTPFDAVIHNVAVGFREPRPLITRDGLPHVFATNSLAPYVLTAKIPWPKRLIYVSSELHYRGASDLTDMLWQKRRWNGNAAYSESKFHNALLAFAVARLNKSVLSNALEPGWVPTKMGGPSARGDLNQGFRTQTWLAVSDDPGAKVSGQYFYHRLPRAPHPATLDAGKQDMFLSECARLSGIQLRFGTST